MAGISPRQRVRLLAAVHFALLYAIAFGCHREWGCGWHCRLLHEYWSVAGLFAAQVSLLAIWGAVGPSPGYVRAVGLAAALVMLSYIYPGIVNSPQTETSAACGWWWAGTCRSPRYSGCIEPSMSWFVGLVILAATVVVSLGVLGCLGLRRGGGEGASRAQYSLGDLLGWTAAIAMLATMCRVLGGWRWHADWVVEVTEQENMAGPIVFGLMTATMSVAMLMRARPAWLVGAGAVPLVGSVMDCYVIRSLALNDWGDVPWSCYGAMYLHYGVVLLGSLWCVRRCGVRLEWGRTFRGAGDGAVGVA